MSQRIRLAIVLIAMILVCGSLMVAHPDQGPTLVAARGDEIPPTPMPTTTPAPACTREPVCECMGACIKIT